MDRSEPPVESKPEAANFPSEQYIFSESHELFKAPQAYPEPPTDMWYQVPEDKPKPAEPPKPIFPWEQERDRPKATRVFAEDLPTPEPTPAFPESSPAPGPAAVHPFSTIHYEVEGEQKAGEVASSGLSSPERVSSPKTADQQWQDFQQNNANAWDSVPGIETYVRAIMESHTRRGKPQVIQGASAPADIASPIISRKDRRESLILTDFPTALERPSLPVTPAPVRRPTFWGEERNEHGELPSAENVPDQADWVCPQCGFSSLHASDFRPSRQMPTSASSIPTATASSAPQLAAESAVEPVAEPAVKVEEASEVQPMPSPSKTKPPKTVLIPTELHPRSGISPRGAPLVSLTDPALLDPHPHTPGFDVPVTTAVSSAGGA